MCTRAERHLRVACGLLCVMLALICARASAQAGETPETAASRLVADADGALREGRCAEALAAVDAAAQLGSAYSFMCHSARVAYQCEPDRMHTLLRLRACQDQAAAEKETQRTRDPAAAAAAESREVWAHDSAQSVLMRLPRVVLQIASVPVGLSVELDGQPLLAEQLRSPIPIEPGRHSVVAWAPGHAFEAVFEARDATSTRIDIRLQPVAGPGTGPPLAVSPEYRERRAGLSGTFALVGANVAATFGRASGDGAGLGAEASIVSLSEEMLWAGGYLDATFATEPEELRLSIGPELGFSFIGIDTGYVLKLGGERSPQHGLSLRPLLTVGVAAVYFRSIWLFGEAADWSAEIGLLLKFPIELH
jgi:hypothetical protein